MKKIKRKLISGGIVAVCAVTAAAAGSRISTKAPDEAIMTSGSRFETTPVIVLDAGHGESG